jgi:hypothetical protein
MVLKVHSHGHGCDCAAHRMSSPVAPDAAGTRASTSGLWSAVLPMLACAVCPACITTYAKLGSVLGVGFGLSEFHHLLLLVVALTASIGLSAWRSWRTKRSWPIIVAITGSSLVVAGHYFEHLHLLEWAGVLVLLAGGLSEHIRLRRPTLVPTIETT